MVASHTPRLGTWPTTQACALTENRTSDPLVLRLVFSSLSHTSQGFLCFFLNRRNLVRSWGTLVCPPCWACCKCYSASASSQAGVGSVFVTDGEPESAVLPH